MRRPNGRYQFLQVIDRGYLIAVFHDNEAGQDHYVYRRGTRFKFWNRMDAPVKDRRLKDAAGAALKEAESERAAA